MKHQTHTRPVMTVSNPSPFLREMLREDSNYAMEWLWAADQVTAPDEVRYCLERALYIDPFNREALRTLYRLNTRRASAGDPQRVNGRGFARTSSDS